MSETIPAKLEDLIEETRKLIIKYEHKVDVLNDILFDIKAIQERFEEFFADHDEDKEHEPKKYIICSSDSDTDDQSEIDYACLIESAWDQIKKVQDY